MSKLGCKCGHVIIDQTDSLAYKANLLRGEDEDVVWDDVRRALQPWLEAAESRDKAAVADASGEFRPWVNATDQLEMRISSIHAQRMSTVYECLNCGRLWVQKDASNRFISYAPDEGGYQAILSAASGESEDRD